MDQASQERLDQLRRTEPGAWTPGDTEFMRSRSAYLTGSEITAFGLEAAAQAAEAKDDDAPAAKPLSKMTLDELKARAAELEIAIGEDDKKADIIEKLEAPKQ